MHTTEAILYVHGKGGNAEEAAFYKEICEGYDVYGVDYDDYQPWVARELVRADYERLSAQYEEISLIANSIGAYFSMLGLQDKALLRAYFISPIVNMERLIMDMMQWSNVSEAELEARISIPTCFGETLSWPYLCYVRENPLVWRTPTAILYAQGDHMTARETVDAFAASTGARLCVMPGGEHWFHTTEQLAFLRTWLHSELASL